MSRTDVHTPDWVKERDPFWRNSYVESHNHGWRVVGHEKFKDENGFTRYKSIWKMVECCDLDVYLASKHHWVDTACQMQYVHIGRNIHCGCKMCTGQYSRRQDRRADRHVAKKMLRAGRWDEMTTKFRRPIW